MRCVIATSSFDSLSCNGMVCCAVLCCAVQRARIPISESNGVQHASNATSIRNADPSTAPPSNTTDSNTCENGGTSCFPATNLDEVVDGNVAATGSRVEVQDARRLFAPAQCDPVAAVAAPHVEVPSCAIDATRLARLNDTHRNVAPGLYHTPSWLLLAARVSHYW